MKTIKRILSWGLVLIVSLIALLVLSVPADALLGRNRLSALVNTTIPGTDGNPDVRVYIAKPEGEGPFPTVIMIHEFFGLNESIVSRANLLAKEGYYVIAPDLFRGSTTAWIPRAIYNVISAKPEEINADLDSTYAWLEAQSTVDSKRIATLGFCFGGRTSLGYSLHNNNIAATLLFYGDPVTDPQALSSLTGPVLGIFAGEDASISAESVQAFDAALTEIGIQHQITTYAGQPHGFIGSAEQIAADEVQTKAWNEMLTFLEANLKNGQSNGTTQQSAYQLPANWMYYLMVGFEHTFRDVEHVH